MQSRVFRLTLVVLLLGSAAGTGLLVWSADQRVRALDSSRASGDERLTSAAGLIAALETAQLAYSAAAQTDHGWFGHIARLVDRIEAETRWLSAESSSVQIGSDVRALLDATNIVVQATARAGDNLTAGNDLMAADLVLAETRLPVEQMGGALQRLRVSWSTRFNSERARLVQRSWTLIASVGGIWMVALVVLAWPRSSRIPAAVETPIESNSIAPLPDLPLDLPAPSVSEIEVETIDMAAVADVCTAISRVTTADEVAALLTRASSVLDAPGIVLWMEAGDSLIATASHGYDPAFIRRIGPIALTANNPTTAAWHTGEMSTAPGDGVSNGAIAAPLWGPAGPVGVLAAEVHSGRESDRTTRSVISLIAAQLSTVVAPLPSIVADAPDSVASAGA